MSDVLWSIDWLGNEGSDNLLEAGEQAEISVWLLIRDTTERITYSSATSYWTANANGANGILSTGTILDKWIPVGNRFFYCWISLPHVACGVAIGCLVFTHRVFDTGLDGRIWSLFPGILLN